MAREGIVQIRRADDSLMTLPLRELSPEDQEFVIRRMEKIREAVEEPVRLAQAGRRGGATDRSAAPLIAEHFEPFVKLQAIQTRWDERYFYVESNGIPAHQMMVGITSWQQQVPLPQKYVGDNAWQIPLHPQPAQSPATTKNRFLRGAIAIAVNGIPIFNPLNNRGDDAYLFGELDEFGGHCGRADDYHYHIAPVHLEKTVGAGKPIAYALDGYPIYGYQDPKAPDFAPLDSLNGHKDAKGNYHYHATKTYPYLNGGFFGEVVEKEGQVDPQPRAEPLRPSLPPLRDAKIVGFEEVRAGSYRLTYEVQGKRGTVSYQLSDNGAASFEFVDPQGRKSTQTYSPKRRGRGDAPDRPGDRPPPRGEKPRRKDGRTGQAQPAAVGADADIARLVVSSSSVDEQGRLSQACTCDGKSESPAVTWKEAPAGTKAFALSLWHTAPDQEKSYWVVYNIPAKTTSVAQNKKPEGTIGLNDRRRAEFDPMCSRAPGLKTYHITVFALSQKIELAPENATRANLLEAIRGRVLAEGTLDFQYERKAP
ncbi:MAG: YHYH protein [Planctomycetes bacterium]|nr:YHYH protein [Planctomycetota bacterium]